MVDFGMEGGHEEVGLGSKQYIRVMGSELGGW